MAFMVNRGFKGALTSILICLNSDGCYVSRSGVAEFILPGSLHMAGETLAPPGAMLVVILLQIRRSRITQYPISKAAVSLIIVYEVHVIYGRVLFYPN